MIIPLLSFKPFYVIYNNNKLNIILLYNFITNLKIKKNHYKKNRRLIRGTGKKPWAQKGMGRARFGDKKNPIWKGGGITFGNYQIKKKKRKKNIFKHFFTLLIYSNKIYIFENNFIKFICLYFKKKNIFYWNNDSNIFFKNIKEIKILDFLKFDKFFFDISSFNYLINNII